MLKKTIALAAGLSLLTGCFTMQEVGNLGNALQRGTILVRSLTLGDPAGGGTQVTNFVGWFSLGGANPTRLMRDDEDITPADGLKDNLYTDEDDTPPGNDLKPGQAYTYKLTFEDSTAETRIVTSNLPDTRLTSTAPLGLANTLQPTLKWSRMGALPKGYLVTVAEVGADGFDGDSLAGTTPTYIAFLDASTHTDEVVYGTPSDLAAITGNEMLSTFLGEMGSGGANFFADKSGNDTVPLENDKEYAWTVVAVDHNDDETAFAIDKPRSIGIFTVKVDE